MSSTQTFPIFEGPSQQHLPHNGFRKKILVYLYSLLLPLMSTSKQPTSSTTKSSSLKRAASPPPPRRHPQQDLLDAIDAAPEDVVRGLLQSLATRYKMPGDRVSAALVLDETEAREPERGGRSVYALCENCQETFSSQKHDNIEGACRYHPGKLRLSSLQNRGEKKEQESSHERVVWTSSRGPRRQRGQRILEGTGGCWLR